MQLLLDFHLAAIFFLSEEAARSREREQAVCVPPLLIGSYSGLIVTVSATPGIGSCFLIAIICTKIEGCK
jgi:hypothetical protein